MNLKTILSKRSLLWMVSAFAALAILACGPDFPNMLLTQGDSAVLVAPHATFAREIERMQLQKSRYQYHPPPKEGNESLEAELADLRKALETRGELPEIIERTLSKHSSARLAVRAPGENIEMADGLPAEFADYFRGCIWWYRGEGESNDGKRIQCFTKACAAWETLLDRPAGDRQYKSTWAAHMLGVAKRLLPEIGADAAMDEFRKVRIFADEGFADSLGLAAASLGLEAQMWFQQGEFGRAIGLYLEQAATGDPSAIESLRMVAAQALKTENGEKLKQVADDPAGRQVITAFLVSGRGRNFNDSNAEGTASRWLDLLETAKVTDVELAEQLALAAYQEGEMDLARRWLNRGSTPSFAVRWLNAKLLLYDGKVDAAAQLLSSLAGDFPVAPAEQINGKTAGAKSFGEDLTISGTFPVSAREQVSGEAGVIRLARREFTEALDALLRSGYWLDAAYVAERVLTPKELQEYVDDRWSAQEPVVLVPEAPFARTTDSDALRTDIRYLLGRRLARAGQEQKARDYLPPEGKAVLDEFLEARSQGRDLREPVRERAQNLFSAAQIMREKGLELFGTETAPDWHVYGGSFSFGVTPEERGEICTPQRLIASKEELTRAYAQGPEPDTRFHYRYVAAELALEAAKLLPDNDLETAIILCTAGSWVKYLDPQAADIYYKMLVRRCRKTPIGKEADRIRWFPRIDEKGNVLPRPVPQPAPPPPQPEVEIPFPIVAAAKDPRSFHKRNRKRLTKDAYLSSIWTSRSEEFSRIQNPVRIE